MTVGETVGNLVRSLSALHEPSRANVEKVLSHKLARVDEDDMITVYEGPLGTPPFNKAELREDKEYHDQGLLILYTPDDQRPTESELHLGQYGNVERVNVNPRIPPEGTVDKIVQAGPCEVCFQLTANTERLLLLSLTWKPKN